jgi:hypothetical protein
MKGGLNVNESRAFEEKEMRFYYSSDEEEDRESISQKSVI